MNTTDLINTIAAETGFTKADTKKVVQTLFQALSQALKKNEDIRISGFGTFYPKKREKTQGRNPQTGAPIVIPEALQAKFRPAKELKETINS
ncbi:MAG: HU family DNA-binding protein [Candidatus Paracaedibacteraceae bacterium]|nr:HU family DNA-binding protein [Candidatus Paracaedibacteraceae bacterium]